MIADLAPWRASWRKAWAPTLSDTELRVLVEALACDDARLIQGSTVESPEPWLTSPAQQACAVGCAIWLARGPMRAGEVQDEWERRLKQALEYAARERVSAYAFLGWWDTQPWDRVRAGLLGEASRSLGMRALNQREIPEGAVALVVA